MNRTLVPLLLPALVYGQIHYPSTPRKAVTDAYHGVQVRDDYRWLEDFNDPAVKKWAQQENATARDFLDRLPARGAIYQELLGWDSQRRPEYRDLIFRHRLFALKEGPNLQQPVLVTLDSTGDPHSERVVVDPNALDPSHTTAIDFFTPSLDGRYVAVSLSRGGSESGDAQVFDVSTGKAQADAVPRVNNGTAGGSIAWKSDGSGFYYTRYPQGAERAKADMDFYQQVYFHRLGDASAKDSYQIGKDFPRIAEVALETSPDGRYIGARVANGDGGDFEFFLLMPGGHWQRLASFADRATDLVFGEHDDAFLLSRQAAPHGKILHVPLTGSLAQAKVFVPEGDAVIEGMVAVPSGLYVRELVGGPSRIRFFPFTGKPPMPVPSSQVAAILELCRAGGDRLLFRSVGYLSPASWYAFDPATGKAIATAMRAVSPVPLADYQVSRKYAVSKNGVKVPVNIVKAKNTLLDGNGRLILTGYGGYGISEQPRFSLFDLALLQQGFTVAYANLRGGGEFGEEWHNQGKLTRKQNVFDDFAAAAHMLIDRKYTNPQKLGMVGGSNGGLLMGAEFTQHPELFHAVVSFVGIYDMLRVELSANGAFNTTEFGTVKELDQFQALYAYSPYHHVREGTEYPAILFLTGNNDPRVDPMQSRKMTARLQASGTRQPVLLRTSSSSGHGIGTSKNEAFAETADAIAFLTAELR